MSSLPQRREEPDVSRFLVDVARRIGGNLDLAATLDQIVVAVAELLAFEVAVLNLVTRDGSLRVVSVAGPEQARRQLLGLQQDEQDWNRLLAAARPMGSLLFVDHAVATGLDGLYSWVPDLEVSDDPSAWHPMDALFAPLLGSDGRLLGVLSVDSPVDGRRPSAHLCQLLELFAVQSALALDNAQVHAQLERSEQLFRATFENAPVGMAVFDGDKRIVQVNPAYCTFLGRTAQELLGCTAADFGHSDDADAAQRLSLAVRQRTGAVYRCDSRFRHADGSTVWGRLSLTSIEGEDGEDQVLAQVEDITAERLARAELERRAQTDSLTGMLNRVAVMELLEQALASGQRVAVLFCDVDHFKSVNDTFGHAAGDELLVSLADDLSAVLRPGDRAGRLGGDEFVVVLRAVRDSAEALVIAERVRAAARRELIHEGVALSCTLTVGVSVGRPGENGPALLAAADRALYAAKQAGRDRCRLSLEAAPDPY